MGFIQNIIKKFSTSDLSEKSDIQPVDMSSDEFIHQRAMYIEENVLPYVVDENYLGMFESIPEVFFPIDYIASRIAGAQFVVKKVKDDSVVWRNKPMNQILSEPNCLMSFRELVYLHFVYRFATGNSYIRAAMSDSFENSLKYEWCSNYWVLPSDRVNIRKPTLEVPLFGIAEKKDLISDFEVLVGGSTLHIPQWQVWHDRDGAISTTNYLKSNSRLKSQTKPISNLIAVYEARNVIYVKRGGLGFLVNEQSDQSGSVALKPEEAKELLTQHYEKYGLKGYQLPYGFSNTPLSFVRTNLSINELMPFDETLADAISIAGAYGIPAVLVPRKDQSTFSNQSAAEKSVYSSQIIPLTKQFCKDFTKFLGLEQKEMYLDCDFSFVDCLQEGMKEAEEVKTKVNLRCKVQFDNGLISINDWRAQIGESKLEGELFDKVKFLMTDEELQQINRVINKQSSVENGRKNQKPTVQNEGK